ncbi:M16 family metallopeptidase [Thalassomonas haliotis]|uniref:Insulinase family protein n=1 Tax=Thalassomonas haliotis TaxID=485448 RepID=A0ABY7VI32_9GAMM|nr:pitrilysin family protein [Thalassomonas haliotis]WDE12879.1 insulinase family protein [Thalassomonas haliotis]
MIKINTLLTLLLMLGSSKLFAAYQLPEYEKIILGNGLTLYLMSQHEVPLIDISLVVKTGAVNDGQQAGLSRLTIKNLAMGSQNLNKNQLESKLDFIGADLYNTSNLEFSQLGASFAAKDKELVLPILRDLAIKPKFDAGEFNHFKKRHLLEIEQNKESPKSVIDNYFNQLLFGPSGYGANAMGREASIAAITLADIKAYHHQWYQPKNAALVAVGDFSTKEMKKQLTDLFSSWQNHSPLAATPKTEIKPVKAAKVLLVNKEDAIESTFLIGGRGIRRSNPDLVGISVVNTILGGRFTSWLNDELRVNAGLTYGAGSDFTSYSRDGTFSIFTFTKTETTVAAIDLALKTYHRLWQQGIDEKTLASAKAYVKGQFPPRFETSSQLANLLVKMYGYGFDQSYINNFEQQVDSLTVDKARQLINKYFPRENLQFVVIGKADKIRDKIAKYGQLTEVGIKDPG